MRQLLPVWSRKGMSIYIGENRRSDSVCQGRQLAYSSLERIEGLEQENITDWTEKATNALISEVHKEVIDKQAATKIGSFLKRQIR